MPIEYVNRRGDKYYLLQGKTKTGKPKYYVSRKADGVAVDVMPQGYELYEHPEQGIVHVRKIRPSKVLPREREQVEAWTRELAGIEYFCVDVQDDCIVVYTPATDPAESASALGALLAPFGKGGASTRDWLGKRATYLPMLRFTLVDEDERIFAVDRWCFRGSIDDWFPLSAGAPLDQQARKYLPHLNRESFYDLM